MKQGVLSLLVDNHFGVLTKVTGLFGRRGYNIKSLSVGETQSPHFSRITIVTEGDDSRLLQICRQVTKLEDVRAAQILPVDACLERELVLIKVFPPEGSTGALLQAVTDFACKTTEVPGGGTVLEATGSPQRMDELVERLQPLGILELSRTGVTALGLDNRALWAE